MNYLVREFYLNKVFFYIYSKFLVANESFYLQEVKFWFFFFFFSLLKFNGKWSKYGMFWWLININLVGIQNSFSMKGRVWLQVWSWGFFNLQVLALLFHPFDQDILTAAPWPKWIAIFWPWIAPKNSYILETHQQDWMANQYVDQNKRKKCHKYQFRLYHISQAYVTSQKFYTSNLTNRPKNS